MPTQLLDQPRHPVWSGLRQVFRSLSRFSDHYYFLTAIIIAQNSVTRQYRDSFLGIIWTVLQPAVQIIVYAQVFSRIMRFPMETYVLYLIGSLLVWQLISSVLTGACNSIIAQGETIKRCIVSLTVFPVADVFRALYTYGISFVVMYGYAVLFLVPFNPMVLALPLFLIPIVIGLMGLSVALAFAAPYVRDIGDVIAVVMSVAFWFTPILYPITAMPENVRPLFEFNPFYIMIRPIAMIVHDGVWPSFYAMATQIGVALFTVAVSYAIYRGCRKNFVYYL